ncbi:MAG TPA: MnhB domain-containing protein [Acidimicrobiales bacterium]|nr:MnhB domain-containing protein [Acidimicrobiales bacterium]
MSPRVRLLVLAVGGIALAVLVVPALVGLPHFGGSVHPYRTHAVVASVAHHSANVISSINFDQRGLDTLGEESIFLASVLGVVVLLRPAEEETETASLGGGPVLESTKLAGYAMVPITLMLGFNIVTHGHLTPGGGFQGGVVLGTGIHLLYVAGTYRALQRARPIQVFDWGEAIGAGAFACLGIASLAMTGAFLAAVIPTAPLGHLFSAGTVPLLNGAVGVEVASGTAVLLAKFLEQAIRVRPAAKETEP